MYGFRTILHNTRSEEHFSYIHDRQTSRLQDTWDKYYFYDVIHKKPLKPSIARN